jgi:flagellar assembly protein FliH
MSPEVAVVPFPLASVPGDGARHARERAAARSAGYAEGWAAGHRDAVAQLADREREREAAARRAAEQAGARAGSALAALRAAADRLDAREAPRLDEVADAVLHAALLLAQDLLGHELTTTGETATSALRRALGAVGAARPVQVRLHPDDVAALEGVEVPTGVTLTADPALVRGDAVAEYEGGSVDARLAAALQRAREVLA